MKKLFLSFLISCVILSLGSMAFAMPFLVCDAQTGIISYNLDIDGVIIENVTAEPDGSIRYDLAGMAVGSHIFKAQAIGLGGWPSGWSDPLDTMKPGAPAGLRVSLE